MALGKRVALEESQERSGEVTRRIVPVAQQEEQRREEQMRRAYVLHTNRAADDPLQIADGELVRITSPTPFTKFEVIVSNTTAFAIGLGRDVDPASFTYDDYHPGNGRLVARCLPTSVITLVPAPGTVVAGAAAVVILHAGDTAKTE
jgi:hypothetical protein